MATPKETLNNQYVAQVTPYQDDQHVEAKNTMTTGTQSAAEKQYFDGVKDILDYFEGQRDANRPLTKDEIMKLRTRQRRDELVSGITDAATALSNMIFTAKGAPNAYDPKDNLSTRARERWDKLWKERMDENDRYMNYALKGHAIRSEVYNQEVQQKKFAQQQYIQEQKLEIQRLKLEAQELKAQGLEDIARQKLEDARIKEEHLHAYRMAMLGIRQQEANTKDAEHERKVEADRVAAAGTTTTTAVDDEYLGKKTTTKTTAPNNTGVKKQVPGY